MKTDYSNNKQETQASLNPGPTSARLKASSAAQAQCISSVYSSWALIHLHHS